MTTASSLRGWQNFIDENDGSRAQRRRKKLYVFDGSNDSMAGYSRFVILLAKVGRNSTHARNYHLGPRFGQAAPLPGKGTQCFGSAMGPDYPGQRLRTPGCPGNVA